MQDIRDRWRGNALSPFVIFCRAVSINKSTLAFSNMLAAFIAENQMNAARNRYCGLLRDADSQPEIEIPAIKRPLIFVRKQT